MKKWSNIFRTLNQKVKLVDLCQHGIQKQFEESLPSGRKERHLEFIENSWWMKFCGAVFPEIFFILIALLFVTLLFLSNLNKAFGPIGRDSGFTVFGAHPSNPLNMLLSLLVFPLDYILITIIIVYFIFVSMAGIRNVGRWFFLIIKSEEREVGLTHPHFSVWYFCLLSFILATWFIIFLPSVLSMEAKWLIESNVTSHDALSQRDVMRMPLKISILSPRHTHSFTSSGSSVLMLFW